MPQTFQLSGEARQFEKTSLVAKSPSSHQSRGENLLGNQWDHCGVHYVEPIGAIRQMTRE
jgi:hypothetical protein